MLLDLEKISFLHFPVLLGVESLWMGVGSPFQTSELKSKEALMVNAHTSRREKKPYHLWGSCLILGKNAMSPPSPCPMWVENLKYLPTTRSWIRFLSSETL